MNYTHKKRLPKYSDNYVVDILKDRGIEDVETYLHPTKELLHDPYLLYNIEKGVNLLASHIAKKSKIHLTIDADADGYISSAIFYNYLKAIAPHIEIEYYVHEGKEHGVIPSTVPADIGLVVVIDAGSAQWEEFSEIKNRGIDCLCLDHHTFAYPEEELDNYPAVMINCTVKGYPNPYLSGGGMAYKFIQVYDEMYGHEYADDYLDLAAVSIIGDMMDLSNLENRTIVHFGLNNIKNPGLLALAEKQSYSIGTLDRITPEKISFYITPLINAIVRMGTQDEKTRLFGALVSGNLVVPSTKRGDVGGTETMAEQNARVATNVRSKQNRLKEAALNSLIKKVEKLELDKHKVILLTLDEVESKAVPSTLTGLVAMELTKTYQRPVIVSRANEEGDEFAGSLRGVNDSKLTDFRQFCLDSGLVEFAAGHANAGGLGIKKENRELFLEYADRELADIDFTESYHEVDYEFTNGDSLADPLLEIGLAEKLWGKGVAQPIIALKSIVVNNWSLMGKNKDTIKFRIGGVDCIKFRANDFINELSDYMSEETIIITFLGKANLNIYMGRVSPQFFITDYTIESKKPEFREMSLAEMLEF